MKVSSFSPVLLLLLLVASCAPAPVASPSAEATVGKQVEGLPVAFIEQHPCRIAGRDAWCGYLPVREKCAAPDSRIINLNVALIWRSRRPPIFDVDQAR